MPFCDKFQHFVTCRILMGSLSVNDQRKIIITAPFDFQPIKTMVETRKENLHLPVAVAIYFANVADAVHLLPVEVAAEAPLALESPVELAASVSILVFSNKPLASHTSATHHQFAVGPAKNQRKQNEWNELKHHSCTNRNIKSNLNENWQK